MRNITSREQEFINTSEDYYHSLLRLVNSEPSEYALAAHGEKIVDRVIRSYPGPWHELEPMEVAAFIHAFSRVHGYFRHQHAQNPRLIQSTYLPRRLEEIGLIQEDTQSRVYDLFRETIILPEHKKILGRINDQSELIFWIEKYYRLYTDKIMRNTVNGAEKIETKVALGILMVHLMSLEIRPYMLERGPSERQRVIEEGEDWTYKLSMLFDDFQRSDDFFGFPNLVDDLHEYTDWLSKRKIERSAEKEAEGLMGKLNQSPPSASNHQQDQQFP